MIIITRLFLLRSLILIGLVSSLVFPSLAQSEESTTIITLRAIAGLQYDKVRFSIKPGQKARLVLTNDDEMSHNLVMTLPGKREEVVKAANGLGDKGPKMNYIPESPSIILSIPLVEPAQSESVSFTAPEKEGVYPYVCTFPGHGFVMFGAMYVTNQGMPPIDKDPNIPPRRNENTEEPNHHAAHLLHPYHPVPPYLYRILMPDAGPAAIAVSLPRQLSYCWDAGSCRLRYAWSGNFIDPEDYWNKKGEHFAKIMGDVFYRDKTKFPLRIGKKEDLPEVDFKGYRLIKSYPEFHYTINGTDVFELIRENKDGNGLERSFRISTSNDKVWFVHDEVDGAQYSSSAGKWSGNFLELSSDEAHQVTLFMTKAVK